MFTVYHKFAGLSYLMYHNFRSEIKQSNCRFNNNKKKSTDVACFVIFSPEQKGAGGFTNQPEKEMLSISSEEKNHNLHLFTLVQMVLFSAHYSF